MKDVPAIVMAATVWAYWTYVGALSVRMRRRTRKLVGIVPSQPLEQLMWLAWVPLVAAWALLPWLAATRVGGPWGLPEFARQLPYAALRWVAAAVGVACFVLSVRCWRQMGASWRMAVTPGEKTALVTTGPYARARHPIYALSILLMSSTLLVVPTAAVALMAAIHIALMITKARNEERHLASVHGAEYLDYCARTGRFLPRVRVREGGRLNLFQRMMLRWRALHPYNPVHVVRVPAALDAERLRACIGRRLERAGLTGFEVLGERRFRYAGGPARVALAVSAADGDRIAALSTVIEREFNRAFDLAASGPFRFVAIDDGQAFDLALVYDHFVAGGDAIALLLTAIASAYLGDADTAPPPRRYPPTYRAIFRRHPAAALRAVLALPRLAASAGRAHRPPVSGDADLANAFAYVLLDRERTAGIEAARLAWGASLNDVLLAALMVALAPFAEARRHAPRRTELAVASILNMRSELGADAGTALSPLLAAFRVSHPLPAGIDLRTLAADVRAQTAHVRRERLYLQSLLALSLSALAWRFLTPERRARLYSKHYPAWAGLTLLNVDGLRAAAGAETSAFDYLRAVPTGPLCPMVFAVTAVGGQLHVGVSFRPAVFPRGAVERVTAEFVRALEAARPAA